MKTTVFDFRKVAYVRYYYRDGNDICRRRRKPTKPTAYGEPIPDELLLRATFQNRIDVWTPVVEVQLTCNHPLVFEGRRAVGIWREWLSRQYGKGKQK